ncbi:MAG: YraN family protein [Candidatus Porifericomitaceae bacterium WSBS_2022_MAG_OTU9]
MKKVWTRNCNADKAAHLVKGAWAERRACDWLRQRGLRLVERNYRVPQGEIDLVMLDGTTLVFVEVRYRSGKWIDPLATLLAHKRQKLFVAADLYMQSHQQFAAKRCRFDVVAVRGAGQEEPKLEWVKDAFNL